MHLVKSGPIVQNLNKECLSWVDRLNNWLKKYSLSIERIIGALFASLMISYAYQLIRHGNFALLTEYVNAINPLVFFPIAAVAFLALILLTVRMNWPRLIPCSALFFCAMVSALWIHHYGGEDKGQFVLGVLVFDLIVLLWLLRGNKLGIPGMDDLPAKMRSAADGMIGAIRSAFSGVNETLGKIGLSIGSVVTAVLAALMMSHVYQLISLGEFDTLDDYFDSINTLLYILLSVAFFAGILVLTSLLKLSYIGPWALMLFTVTANFLLAYLAQGYSGDDGAYFALGVGLFDLVIMLWLSYGDRLGISSLKISRRTALIAGAVLFVVTTAMFGYITMLKYRSYTTFTFDFGIFSQMFERMAETGQPYTTVERSYMMLHYGVHFSPFFYIFLPGYYIFRSPVYLYFIQAGGIAAGVFAVWLLAGKLGLSGKMTLALEVLYILFPCLFDGAFYDFHENKFLTAVILFLFYFIISQKPLGIFGFSLLLLSIKEDAAIYLMVIAVFVMIRRKEILTGAVMLGMAIAYFVFAQGRVAASGEEGVMMSRLQDYFINGEQTFGSVIKAVFYDLGYVIGQVFTPEKLPFMIWMLAPVLFAPFMTGRISSLVLLLPILPINLMQSWEYQYNIDYQYTYGVAALVIVSAILIIIKLGPVRRRALLLTMLCVSMMMSVMLNAPKIKRTTEYYNDHQEVYEQVDELLEQIPDDATVTACDAMVPHLYKIKWLFTVPEYYSKNWGKNPILPSQADYCVVDLRYQTRVEKMQAVMGDNYVLVGSVPGYAELYERKVKVRVTE